jgi:hypothetical protein
VSEVCAAVCGFGRASGDRSFFSFLFFSSTSGGDEREMPEGWKEMKWWWSGEEVGKVGGGGGVTLWVGGQVGVGVGGEDEQVSGVSVAEGDERVAAAPSASVFVLLYS